MAHLTSTWRSRMKTLAEQGDSSAQQLLVALPNMPSDEASQMRAQEMAENIYNNATNINSKEAEQQTVSNSETNEENREENAQNSASNIEEQDRALSFMELNKDLSPEQNIIITKAMRQDETNVITDEDIQKLFKESFKNFLNIMGVESDPTHKYLNYFTEKYGTLRDFKYKVYANKLNIYLWEVIDELE